METRSIIFLAVLIVVLSIGVFYACNKVNPPVTILSTITNQEAVESCLTVQVMDRTYQIDGKVEVAYTNICPNYEFRLTKTGLKYQQGKKVEYLTRNTPLYLSASGTQTLELSIPHFIKPRAAYVLADDAKSIAVK